mgnify:CR=1 FL=1|jgi:hypothetical protein
MNATATLTLKPVGNLRPCMDCLLDCAHHGSSLCVPNLVGLHGEGSPITFGLRIGLNHVFADTTLPPCVRGPLGAAYWSTQPGDEMELKEPTFERSVSRMVSPG